MKKMRNDKRANSLSSPLPTKNLPSRTSGGAVALWAIVVCCLLLTNCRRQTSLREEVGDTLRFSYAENLLVVKYPQYIVAELKDPWKKGHTLHTYVLVKEGVQPPSREGSVIKVPLKRSVVFNTAHASLCEMLGADAQIKGVCDLKYMNLPRLQQRVKLAEGNEGRVVDCGDSMQPDIERIVDMKADAVLLSPFENSGGYGRLEKIGVPIVECADYMETSALGRAEWMKFYGLLYGKEREADSLFHVVDSVYHSISEKAKGMKRQRSMITEKLTGNTWYVAGGRSTVGQLIADANGEYMWASDEHSGSLALAFETILEKAGQADVWVFNWSSSAPATYQSLAAEYHGYKEMKAFRERHVWYIDTQKVPYFEEVSFRPDCLLRDYVLLLHPEASESLGGGTLVPRYFTPLGGR